MNPIAANATHAPLYVNSFNPASDANHSPSLAQIQGNVALARVLLHMGKPVVQWMGQAATQGIQLVKASAMQLDRALQNFNLPTANAEVLRNNNSLVQGRRLLQRISTQPTSQGLGSTITGCQFNSTVSSTVGAGSTLTNSTFLGKTHISVGANVTSAHFEQSVEVYPGCDLNQVTCLRAASFSSGSHVNQCRFEGAVDLAVNTEVNNVTARGLFTANSGAKVVLSGKSITFISDAKINLATEMTSIPSHWLGVYVTEENNNYIFDQEVTISQDTNGNLEIEVGSATASPTKAALPTPSPVNLPFTQSPTHLPQTAAPIQQPTTAVIPATPSPFEATVTTPPTSETAGKPAYTTPPWVNANKPTANKPTANSAASSPSPNLMTTLAVASATVILTNQLHRN